MNIRGKKILVTGGTGFIGSYTVKELVKKGAHVVIVDHMTSKRKVFRIPGTKLYKIDLASPQLKNIFEKELPEYVFHFAGNILVHKTVEAPLAEAKNITASLNLMQYAHHFGVKKIIFASSGIVYGNSAPQPTSEKQPVDLVNPYAISKYTIENYLLFYKKAFGMPCVILRYSTVYGPEQIAGALTDYIRKLREGKQADIWGDGTKTRDYIFIDDIVRANILALDVPDDFPNPIFNISTGKETSLNELYALIAKLLKTEARPLYHPDRPGEQKRYCLNPSKFEKLVGWKAKINLKQGLQRVTRK